MKIILSPSKTFHKDLLQSDDIPYFKSDANRLIKMLKKVSPEVIQSSMKLSDALLDDVVKMIHDYDQFTSPAIYTYHGQAFKMFDVMSLSESDLKFMQDHLLIISGLYGLLKPFDGITLYRLEMQDQTITNLYAYWRPKIEKYLNTYCQHEMIINLASEEYSKVIPTSFKMITIDFMEMKQGKAKRISMNIKAMRGLFARYLIQHRIETLDNLKKITINDYHFDPTRSTAYTLVFKKEV